MEGILFVFSSVFAFAFIISLGALSFAYDYALNVLA